MKLIIGIDPGKSGGLAYMLIDGKHFLDIYACKMPDDPCDIPEIIHEWSYDAQHTAGVQAVKRTVYMENPNGIPFRPKAQDDGKTRQGLASTAKFNRNIGFIHGVLVGMGVNHTLISPMKLMNALNCRTGGDKRVTRNLAIKMFPELKVTHATADALLICHYGSLQ